MVEVKRGYKKTEIGIISEDWELKSVIKITNKNFWGFTYKVDYVESNSIPLVKATYIAGVKLNFNNMRNISLEQHKKLNKYRKVKLGDFLVSKSASLGICALVEVEQEFSIYESIIASQLNLNDENIRLAIISKLAWIKKQQAKFKVQPRQSKREMLYRESHYFLGIRYRLEVVETTKKNYVNISNNKISLYVKQKTDEEKKLQILNKWYRGELNCRIPKLIKKWEKIIGVQVSYFGIRKMKTKWGSCNITDKRICLNIELAKKPLNCLEYIIVHEMVHLLEKNHNKKFKDYMDNFLPQWKLYKELLNHSLLSHEEWSY